MAARQDAERLRQLLQGDAELIKVASDYLARLRMLASTVGSLRDNATALAPIAALLACEEGGSDTVTLASAQKASFRRPGEFQNCLKAVRSLLVQKSASTSPQKPPPRSTASISFESLAGAYRHLGIGRGAVQEMNRTMQEWERLLDKAKGGKHTGAEDPRYMKAIFVWVLTSLKYPVDKAAFCAQQNMRQVDLTNILQSLDARCYARKAALEKKTELHYHGPSNDEQEPVITPTKGLKRKASTIDMPDELITPTKRPYTPSLLSGKRDSPNLSARKSAQGGVEEESPTKRMTRSATGTQITPTKRFSSTLESASSSRSLFLPSSAQSSHSGQSSNLFDPSPTKSRGRPLSPEPLPASPSDSEEEDEDERYSPPPPPKYRLRPLFLETLGLSRKDNMREVKWFRGWRERVLNRGFESESEEEIEEFEESQEGFEDEQREDGHAFRTGAKTAADVREGNGVVELHQESDDYDE